MKKYTLIAGLIALLPVLYLTSIWNEIPDKVPIHWGFDGQIDGYGNKSDLIFLSLLLPFSVYLLFLFLPKIDPKNRLHMMGNKLGQMNLVLTLVNAVIAIFIIYASVHKLPLNIGLFSILTGVLFIVLGNFMPVVKPNYFLGIRTPWTLENLEVWKKTHQVGGKLMFYTGILMVISSFVLSAQNSFVFTSLLVLFIVLFSFIYSYWEFKKLSPEKT